VLLYWLLKVGREQLLNCWKNICGRDSAIHVRNIGGSYLGEKPLLKSSYSAATATTM
jgi:hypothetical protein